MMTCVCCFSFSSFLKARSRNHSAPPIIPVMRVMYNVRVMTL